MTQCIRDRDLEDVTTSNHILIITTNKNNQLHQFDTEQQIKLVKNIFD